MKLGREMRRRESLAERAVSVKKRGRGLHVGKSGEVSAADRTRDRRIHERHVGPPLLEVGDAVFSGDFRPETRLDFTPLEFFPINRLKPFVALDFLAPLRTAP